MSPFWSTVLVLVAFVVFIGGIFLLMWRSERRDARLNAEDEAKHRKSMDETVRWMKANDEKRRQAIQHEDQARDGVRKQLVAKSWAEARALCEKSTGEPCECPTREAILQVLWPLRNLPYRRNGRTPEEVQALVQHFAQLCAEPAPPSAGVSIGGDEPLSPA